MDTPTRERALLFAITSTTQYSLPAHTENAELHVITHADRRDIKNPSDYRGESDRKGQIDEACLQDLVIHAALSTDFDDQSFGWDVSFRRVYDVKLEKARRMTRTLETIQRKLDKLEARYGQPADFGQYVARVAEAVGATTIAFEQRHTTTGLYSHGEYWFRPIGEAVGTINHKIYSWHEAHPSTRHRYQEDAS